MRLGDGTGFEQMQILPSDVEKDLASGKKGEYTLQTCEPGKHAHYKS